MKKFLLLIAILLAILALLIELVVPSTVENIVKDQIVHATSATAVDVSLSTKPNFRIALGEIDKMHATAAEGRIGEVDFKNLTLDGEKIRFDIVELLFPNKDLTSQERTQRTLKHADKIEMHGVITEEELRNFIANKNEKFQNTQVTITPEGASATATIKFLGRTINLDVAGTFIVDNGDIYFHMTNLKSNSILSRVNIDSFLTDIKVLESAKLPLNLKFDSVELREGEAIITAFCTVK